MRIGIMGGTFNPIHQGHLIQCEIVRESKELDKIIFVPNSSPPHKRGGEVVDSNIRKTMLEIAIESNPYFSISELEIQRPGLSYTVDSLKEFKELYPEDELFLIIGVDSLLKIHTWKDYESILASVDILVMERYNSRDIKLEEVIEMYRKLYGSRIERIPTPIIELSSTNIRKRVGEGQSIKYMVPDGVEKYIKERKIYIGEGK